MPWIPRKPTKPKTCQKCGKEYIPNAFSQKYCRECSPHLNPKSSNRCEACGRATNGFYVLPEDPTRKLCSFCSSAKHKLEVEKRLSEKNPKKIRTCNKCGSYITKSEYREFGGLCPSCYFQQTKVKVTL